jgi:hypothetical protein
MRAGQGSGVDHFVIGSIIKQQSGAALRRGDYLETDVVRASSVGRRHLGK